MDKRYGHLILLVIGLSLVAAILMSTVDLPVARWCFAHKEWAKPWDELRDCIMLSEIFGHVWGVVLVGVAVFLLDPARRRSFARLTLPIIAAGIAPNLIKMVFVRFRPRYFFDESSFSGPSESIWQSFGGFQMGLSSNFQSFPSGHSALACGLAVVLTHLYPRGKVFFAALAALVMLQRVVVSAHFPSDTFAGATLGILVASLCLPRETTHSPPATTGRGSL